MTLLKSLTLAKNAAHSSSQATSQELTNLRHSFMIHQNQFLPIDFYRLLKSNNMSQNIYLQPNDFVYVPSSLTNKMYILKTIKNPQTVAYQEPMSLISAIANSNNPDQLQ